MGQILSNPSFWAVGLTGACYSIALAIVLSGIQLYVRYTLGLPVAYSFFLQAAVILIAAGGLALWSRMITRIGALRTWRIARAEGHTSELQSRGQLVCPRLP